MKISAANKINFHLPFVSVNGFRYIEETVTHHTSFSKKCKDFFKEKYKFKNTFLTSSCTDALEMAAILADIMPGDEVIIPAYTYVSSANPFVMRGAHIVFADSGINSPGIDADKIESLITEKTKVIVVVHYGGHACDMDKIMNSANAHHIIVVEDAAHAIDGFYKNKPLGSIGHLAAFSFHDTKNISCGEGGMLVANDENLVKRAEIIFEKGTNRAAFNRGEVSKYEWMDIGSSFAMSEITAAYLFSQLENLEEIQAKRKQLWDWYYQLLKPLAEKNHFQLSPVSNFAFHNAHLFHLVCASPTQRDELMNYLSQKHIPTAFHYLSLHSSPFYKAQYKGMPLTNSDKYSDCLLRLPLHYHLKKEDVEFISEEIKLFFKKEA